MRLSSSAALVSVLLLSSGCTVLIRAHGDDEGESSHHHKGGIFRWASGGVGFPAMVADMALANIFGQAGVISNNASATDASHFSAISTASGASWFATQFFYSPSFFEQTALAASPSDLQEFVLDWLNGYQTFADNRLTNPQNANCKEDAFFDLYNATKDIPVFAILDDVCLVLLDYNGDWAAFVSDMLNAVVSSVMGESGFSSKFLNADSVIPSMSETDLYIQTSIVPNSRIRSPADSGETEDLVIYIGPERQVFRDEVYSLPLSVQFSVRADDESTDFFANAPFPSGVRTHEASKSQTFQWIDWQRFGLFPATLGIDVDTTIQTPINSTSTGALQIPFGSGAAFTNLGQVAAASSAGYLSGITPSVLMQAASTHRYNILQSSPNTTLTDDQERELLGELTTAINAIYTTPVVDNMAMCSQWPNPCSDADARFVDGSVSDPLTAGLNVGQYQAKSSGSDGEDGPKTIRLVITDTSPSPHAFLSYFNTSFNQGIAPGDFFWPQDSDSNGGAALFELPKFSPQIFADYLDLEQYEQQVKGVDDITGYTIETMTMSTTTIDNDAYQTEAGQAVDILYVAINVGTLPSLPLDVVSMAASKDDMAQLAAEIAGSTELVNRVKQFFFPPTPAPTPGPPAGGGGGGSPTDDGGGGETSAAASTNMLLFSWTTSLLAALLLLPLLLNVASVPVLQ